MSDLQFIIYSSQPIHPSIIYPQAGPSIPFHALNPPSPLPRPWRGTTYVPLCPPSTPLPPRPNATKLHSPQEIGLPYPLPPLISHSLRNLLPLIQALRRRRIRARQVNGLLMDGNGGRGVGRDGGLLAFEFLAFLCG
jgi:hypothetical protein